METLFALLFILISVSLAGAAFALMWKNISDISKSSNNFVESSKRITKIPHPELLEVKPGDELMVVNFKKPRSEDPLLQSLEDRIDELKNDNDDDDDGDIVIRA